ncbi:MAG: HD-GYP domain-containing protein [Armatimonadetes bacterium]|nr:HD-GYP domain-containing protein [Armatimonadota bacterium]
MARAQFTFNNNVRQLFTGDSLTSKMFQLAIAAAAVGLMVRTYLVAPEMATTAPFTGPAAILAAVLTVALVGLGGLFPLPLGHKIHLSLGSSAAFATLLVFPPQEAIPLAFAGTLIAQVIRWKRGDRLTLPTIIFNLMQYVVTWSLAADVYYRAQANLLLTNPAFSWLPVVATGAIYLLTNTWIVSTWAALRRRAWTWDLWVRALREAGSGYAASLALGAAAAGLVVTRPLLVLALVPLLASLRHALARMSGIIVRQSSAALEALVEITEQGSPFTAEHSERVSWWAQRLARHLNLSADEVELVGIAAKLHDLGKAVLPQAMLLKNGPLTDEEWALMHRHPAIGAQVISRLPGFEAVARYVRYHHERYDGGDRGYPGDLQGAAIPLGARIIAVADSYDAMISARPYRPGMSKEQALAQISANRGTQFDSRVASALLELAQGEAEGITVAEPQQAPALQWQAVSSR